MKFHKLCAEGDVENTVGRKKLVMKRSRADSVPLGYAPVSLHVFSNPLLCHVPVARWKWELS
jgi:hypothetical protein